MTAPHRQQSPGRVVKARMRWPTIGGISGDDGAAGIVGFQEVLLPRPLGRYHDPLPSHESEPVRKERELEHSRPNLVVVRFDGSGENNIVGDFHGASIILDPREPDPQTGVTAGSFCYNGVHTSFRLNPQQEPPQ